MARLGRVVAPSSLHHIMQRRRPRPTIVLSKSLLAASAGSRINGTHLIYTAVYTSCYTQRLVVI